MRLENNMPNESWFEALKSLLGPPDGAELFVYEIDVNGSKILLGRGALSRDVRMETLEGGGVVTWLRPLMDPTAVQKHVEYFDLDVYRPRAHNSTNVQVDSSGSILFIHPDGDEIVVISRAGEDGYSVNSDWDDWVAVQDPDFQERIHSLAI
jgi:hypothetical protein